MDRVRGWCPGALRPMASGDGLLVRLRVFGGVLDAATARAIAGLAARYGNGLIDLSARANLQIRGVTQAALPALQEELASLGLIDEDPEIEAIRNVLVSPLAGVDPAAQLDIRPLLAALDQRLRNDAGLRALPGKFGFLIDDGGALPLNPAGADIAFVAESADRFAVYLGGGRAGVCAPDDLVETAARQAERFLSLRRDERRMSRLMDRLGERAGPLDPRPPARPLGYRTLGPLGCVGAGLPFGRLTAEDLITLSKGELRLTPWRAILIVGPEVTAELLDGTGFITGEDDPRRAVAACPGHPACASGESDARADALFLAPVARRLGDGVTLHVSACPKGCAMAAEAPVTLVATGSGYDVVLGGRAGDPPAWRDLALAEIADRLAQRPLSPTNRPERSKASTAS